MDSLTTLTRLGGGKFLEDLAQLVTNVAQDVVRTGNKGGVSATITIEKQGDEPMVIVLGKVQAKPPAEKPQTTLFYAVDGDLWREDPRQYRMEFRVVDEGNGEIKTIDGEPEVREAAE